MIAENTFDVCVVGGGFMGAAVALGLTRYGAKVLMVDRISTIHRASRANFGLVWSQSKGLGNRAYSRLSQKAVEAFKPFTDSLENDSGIKTELRLGAGLILSMGPGELEARQRIISQLHREAREAGEIHPSRMVDRAEIQALVGPVSLGEKVSGGSLSDMDGDVNPLLFLKAMRQVFRKNGGTFWHGCQVSAITRKKDRYQLHTSRGPVTAPKIVLAAGLGNMALAGMVGKKIPLVPQKGQLLVTRPLQPFLPFPLSGLRQTACGSVMIGYTQENTGFEVSTTAPAAVHLARKALDIFPCLAHAGVVRSWAGLRVLTGDGLPVYDEIEENVFAFATHSCVTLAPIHATLLPPWILEGRRAGDLHRFTLERFHV